MSARLRRPATPSAKPSSGWKTVSRRSRRIGAANDALENAAPLPGKDRRAWLFDLDVQFETHLDLLALGIERAAEGDLRSASAQRERIADRPPGHLDRHCLAGLAGLVLIHRAHLFSCRSGSA